MQFTETDLQTLRREGLSLLELDRKSQQGSQSHHGYVCPVCGSGSGPKGTGMTGSKEKPERLTCWACHEIEHADIFEIIGRRDSISSFPEQVIRVAELLGYQLEGSSQRPNNRQSGKDSSVEDTPVNYTDYYWEANRRLGETDYHRGISIETLNHFLVGYDPEWRHPKVPDTIPSSPRLIIPTSQSSYLARDTRPDDEIPEEAKNRTKMKVGRVHNFNEAALAKSYGAPIFVAESELDALSIIDVGGVAVGLGGVSNVDRMVKAIEEHRLLGNSFIIWTDADTAGQRASQTLLKKLLELHIPCVAITPLKGYKDANEALMADRKMFEMAVVQAVSEAMDMIARQKEEQRAEYQQKSVTTFMDGFSEYVRFGAPVYPTGLQTLDKLLDGGLHPGLTCIGSVSSGGKTTLSLQIADHTAASGVDVLFFSLEMGRYELIAKSLSRLTMAFDHSQLATTNDASSTREVLNGRWYKGYSQEKQMLIRKAERHYRREIAPHLYIFEGTGDIGVSGIRSEVEQYMAVMEKHPLVVIDYLQILAPAVDPRATDKQNLDKSVLELKRMTRDLEIPVLAITSYNRANYDTPVNLASAKESGGIEYMFDTVLGLQQEGMDYEGEETDRERNARIRGKKHENEERFRAGRPVDMQLKVLKQRNGARGNCFLQMWPKFNYFEDMLPDEWCSKTEWQDISLDD